MKLTTKLLAAGALLAAAQANAVVIDFTSAPWDSAGGLTSYTDGIVTVTAGPAGEKLYYDAIDGLGVDGLKEPDEIDLTEFIEISFTSDVWVEKIFITDFFNRANEPAGDGSDPVRGEVAYISFWLDGVELIAPNSPQTIYGDNSEQINGEQTLSYAPLAIVFDTVKFSTAGINDDLSVKGLEYFIVPETQTNVPEPSIAVLLGLGLMGLGLSRRRQAKKA
ncbi:PEP-CTERM sorting domain-containing protein [Cellvibrio sp. NN19]|uniref:PEP-CTERM sorting domain-containing protein n=1 Tax=Cellvibrio chitinivorans TaxID=3102792 RepID=UPI002B41070E|nr:PEP-CTERM sorting domain-containing protein [Cellvibrio sp. NN19]